jgi:hypothetical protein
VALLRFHGEAKIGEFDVAVLEDEYILRFEVSVHVVVLVEELQTKDDTTSNETNGILTKGFKIGEFGRVGFDESVGISTNGILHNKIDPPRVLKCHKKVDNKIAGMGREDNFINNGIIKYFFPDK